MARIVGWLIRYGDVAPQERETVLPGAVRLGYHDIEVVSAHGIRDYGIRQTIGRVGITAALEFRREGVWIAADVLPGVRASVEAELLVRLGVIGGWSMEMIADAAVSDGRITRVQSLRLFGAGLTFRPAYRGSRAWVED